MMVLSDFAPDVRALADVEAFGVVLQQPDERARLVTRHRAGVAAHLLPLDRLVTPFLPSLETVTAVAPLTAHVDVEHPFVDRLVKYGIDCVLVLPLPDGIGAFWIGKRGAELFAAAQAAELERVAARVAAAIREPESRDARLDRQSRIDAVEQMLPIVARALDVRQVFRHLSAVARYVLPHDAATIQILSDDHTVAQIYALDGMPRNNPPAAFPTNYAPLFNEHFEFSLHDDLQANAAERDRPAAKAGFRSALRLPLRFNGRIGGTVEFSSCAIGAYRETDVSVGERIADYVSLAIAHQRMADDARRAAELRARSQNLLALDDLVATLSGVLDLREVFDRVSEIAKKVLPHDAMGVTSIDRERKTIRVHAISGFGESVPDSFEAPMPEPDLLTEPWEFRIIEDMTADPRYAGSPTARAGMRSILGLPVRLEGRLRGGVNFYRRSKGTFTPDDILIGRRIAEHVTLALSHQRLAEEARSTAGLTARAANLELLDDLLAALTDASALSDMFDRVSAIAKKVIVHDAMVMPVTLADDQRARIYASAGMKGLGLPEVIPVPEAFKAADFDHEIIGDLSLEPGAHNARSAAMGFRSALRVAIRFEGRFAAGVSFLSRDPGVYKPEDVLVARRIADRFALCLRRERAFDAAKRADEASSRAARLEARVRVLTDELDARTGHRRVVGQSPSWKLALTQATQVASTDTTVLLLGESGTGKEVVARFLHRASPRRDGPFIALNCAALPEQLLEAELFGYERGAYTGATQSKPGQLEQAAGGTLFLDEVGEMALPAQAKFLRVLQEREFQRLGGTRILRTDARVVAATNRDLQLAMGRGQFREDLFYRLNVFAIRLPPLRDRREDILPLSESFVEEIGRGLGRPPAGISKDARKLLMDYHWPGNIRELRNILERAAILCDGGLITAEHLALHVAAPRVAAAPVATDVVIATPSSPTDGQLDSMERAMIEQALANARFNKSKAAKALGLTRAQLYVRMRRYGLE